MSDAATSAWVDDGLEAELLPSPAPPGATGYLLRDPQQGAGMEMEVEAERALCERALTGERAALETLIRYLTPVIQCRCGRTLVAAGGGAHRNLRDEVDDMAQEVFATLLERDARILRAWQADRGLSLRNFVGMIARRKANAVMATHKRNPWYERPLEAEAVERALPEDTDAERKVAAQQVMHIVIDRVGATQSEKGREMLVWMIQDGLSQEELRARSQMSDAAIYQWRSRILRAVRTEVDQLLAEGTHPRGVTP